jgi:peptidoglycan/LPS O-acetylase OafA/YrhL
MSKHLEPLTGLRGIAAYSVMIAHGVDSAFSYGGAAVHCEIVRLAFFGMTLFFVLSGFVLYYNYAESFGRGPFLPALGAFFVARFARLYPLYIVALSVSLPHLPPATVVEHPAIGIAYLTMTQSWFNVPSALFPPLWSISTEWFFYFAFVPLVPIVAALRLPLATLVIYCAAALLVLGAVLYAFEQPMIAFVRHWMYVDDKVSVSPWFWLSYEGPIVRLFEFVAGMLGARAYLYLRSRPISPAVVSVTIMVALAWCVGTLVFGPPTDVGPGAQNSWLQSVLPNFFLAPPLVALMVCTSLAAWHRVSAFLSSRPLQFMGDISYSVYIWSFFAFSALAASYRAEAWSFESVAQSVIKVVAIAAATTIFAYGSYRLIEVPSRRWLRARLSPRSADHKVGYSFGK